MRIIELNSNNKITNVRHGSCLSTTKNELFSDIGLLGQIMISDRVFENDIYVDETDIANKIKELDAFCTNSILAGFYSSVKGESHLYGLDYNNQINIESIKNNFCFGFMETYDYYYEGGDCVSYSKDEFMILYNDAMTHKLSNVAKYKTLSQEAKTCTLKTELELIRW